MEIFKKWFRIGETVFSPVHSISEKALVINKSVLCMLKEKDNIDKKRKGEMKLLI